MGAGGAAVAAAILAAAVRSGFAALGTPDDRAAGNEILRLTAGLLGGRFRERSDYPWYRHAAYGIALGTVRERMDRFEEAVQILRSLLGQPRTTFRGDYFQLQDAPGQPAPVQDRLPLTPARVRLMI